MDKYFPFRPIAITNGAHFYLVILISEDLFEAIWTRGIGGWVWVGVKKLVIISRGREENITKNKKICFGASLCHTNGFGA